MLFLYMFNSSHACKLSRCIKFEVCFSCATCRIIALLETTCFRPSHNGQKVEWAVRFSDCELLVDRGAAVCTSCSKFQHNPIAARGTDNLVAR